MKSPRLFLSGPLQANSDISIGEKPAHYLQHVLRLKTGDALTVFNGEGGEYSAHIISTDRKEVRVHLGNLSNVGRESPLAIHLGLAVTKKDRMDLALQKAVELGVTEVTPLLTEYTSISHKLLAKRQIHWRGIIESACEQCGRNRVPSLYPVATFDAWVSTMPQCPLSHRVKFVCHPLESGQSDSAVITQEEIESAQLLIGPEGGFSQEELQLANSAGFQTLFLGARILRTETAVASALTLFQFWWGDLKC